MDRRRRALAGRCVGRSRARGFRARHTAPLHGPLLHVPRGREAARPDAVRREGHGHEGDRARPERREPAHPSRAGRRPRAAHALRATAPARGEDRTPAPLDRRGCGLARRCVRPARGEEALGLRPAPPPRAARAQGRPRTESHRPLRALAAREGGPPTVARGRPRDPSAAAEPRPRRPPAHDRGGRRLPEGQAARCLGPPGRAPARLAALRRALGSSLARRRALRRLGRLREGQAAHGLVLPRLGGGRPEPRPAVRPLRHRADRRRPARDADPGPARGHRLPPQLDDQRGGRRRPRAVPDGGHVRPHGRGRQGRPRPHHPVRPVPQPQVRSPEAGGVLPALRLPERLATKAAAPSTPPPRR